jgi:hypothetical protein
MGLEVTTTIQGLVETNPVAGDPLGQSDDHIRLLKTVLKATPLIVDRAYVEYTTNADLTTVIPYDDTIPQNTEGTQILSLSFAAKSTTNRVRGRFRGFVSSATSARNVIAAVFSSASASAIAATITSTPGADQPTTIDFEFEYVPASTSSLTYTVRLGPQAGTVRMNGNSAGRLMGGVSSATLILEEIQA